MAVRVNKFLVMLIFDVIRMKSVEMMESARVSRGGQVRRVEQIDVETR